MQAPLDLNPKANIKYVLEVRIFVASTSRDIYLHRKWGFLGV